MICWFQIGVLADFSSHQGDRIRTYGPLYPKQMRWPDCATPRARSRWTNRWTAKQIRILGSSLLLLTRLVVVVLGLWLMKRGPFRTTFLSCLTTQGIQGSLWSKCGLTETRISIVWKENNIWNDTNRIDSSMTVGVLCSVINSYTYTYRHFWFRFSTQIEDLILQQLLAPSEPFSKLPNPILITLLSFRHPYSSCSWLTRSIKLRTEEVNIAFLNACL